MHVTQKTKEIKWKYKMQKYKILIKTIMLCQFIKYMWTYILLI